MSIVLRVLAICMLLILPVPAAALIFHSDEVSKQWDTWVFVENGTFYAYCMRLSAEMHKC